MEYTREGGWGRAAERSAQQTKLRLQPSRRNAKTGRPGTQRGCKNHPGRITLNKASPIRFQRPRSNSERMIIMRESGQWFFWQGSPSGAGWKAGAHCGQTTGTALPGVASRCCWAQAWQWREYGAGYRARPCEAHWAVFPHPPLPGKRTKRGKMVLYIGRNA